MRTGLQKPALCLFRRPKLEQILYMTIDSLIRKPGAPRVIDLIEQIESTETFKGGNRKKPDELRANYRFEEQSLAGLPRSVGIVDDVLTTGSHFRAIKDMILERLPDHRVVGFFVARRAIPSPFENVPLED